MATDSSTTDASARRSIIQFAIRDNAALHAAYVPMFLEGGIFVPRSTASYRLGDGVYVLLTLPDGPDRYPIAGTVAWINPPRVVGGRVEGIGVRFPDDESAVRLRARIEHLLGTSVGSNQPTQTA